MAVRRKRYRVNVERDGKWWFIQVPELPGVFSQARRLEQVREMASDAIATMLQVRPDSFEIDARLVGEVGAWADAVRQARNQLAHAQAYAAATQDKIVRHLTGAGLSMRDIAMIIGLSHQRVAQLLGDIEPKGAPDTADLMSALEASVRAARKASARRRVAAEGVPVEAAKVA